MGCASETIVEKEVEVIKEVVAPVEKIVEKEVVKEVQVEVEKIVEVEKEVVKEVMVEKEQPGLVPNYWGVDEKHPDNRLPYADSVTLPIIPDPTTQLAAFRTGKLDATRAQMMQDMELYQLRDVFFATLPYPNVVNIWHPWLGGFQGEGLLGQYQQGALAARLWIVDELKR